MGAEALYERVTIKFFRVALRRLGFCAVLDNPSEPSMTSKKSLNVLTARLPLHRWLGICMLFKRPDMPLHI